MAGEMGYASLAGSVRSLASRVEDLERQIAAMDDDIPEWSAKRVEVDGGGSEYASYFKVIDASVGDGCKIGVTSGGAVVAGICGVVKINNERADVEAVTEALSAAGTYYVWIHSWIDAVDGAQAEIIVGAADDDDPPDNPNGGVAYASQLAGRVTVDDGAITGITQDYLTGGEHFEILFGDCEGEEIRVTP